MANQMEGVRRLLKETIPWYSRKHGEVGYHLTQVLSGHGCFQFYKWRFKISDNASCLNCTAEHAIFHCERWAREKVALETTLNSRFTVDEMITLMLKSVSNWNLIEKYIYKIMDTKIKEEREIDSQCQNARARAQVNHNN